MKQSDIEKALEREIYTNRMIVLLEMEDGFAQMVFTEPHFKAVSDAVAKGFPLVKKEGEHETLSIKLGEERIPTELFEGMSDYDEENTPETED